MSCFIPGRVCAKSTCLRGLYKLEEQQELDITEDSGRGIAGYETENETGPESERP